MSKFLFSILVPNVGFNPFLIEAIDSAIQQRRDNSFDYEVLLLDQSEDDTHNIIIHKIKRIDDYGRVHFFWTHTKSIVKARIELIKKAKGEYIVFLDSDDYISKDYLSNIYSFLTTNNYPDIVIDNVILVDIDKRVLSNQLSVPCDIKEHLLDYFYYSNYLNSIVRKIFRRHLFCADEVPPIEIINGDDWLVSLPIMKNAQKIMFVDETFGYYYRQHNESTTHRLSHEVSITALYFKDHIINLAMNCYQKQLYLKQKLFDFINFYRFLVDKKIVKMREFIFEAKTFRKNIIIELSLSDSSLLIKKHKLVYKLLKYKLYFLLFLVFKL